MFNARAGCVALFLILLTACHSAGPSRTPVPGAAQLAGSRWTTLLIGEEGIRHSGSPTLEFLDELKIGGYAGCNGYHGKVHVSGGSMRFINVGSTLVGCDSDVLSQEQNFLNALTAVRTFRMESGRLVLLDDAGKQRLLLEQDLSEPSLRSPSRRVASVVLPKDVAPYASSAGPVGSSMSMPDLRNFRLQGLELVTMTDDLGDYFGTKRGALVVRAPPENIFKLKEGDVLVSVNDRQPATGEHALRILGSYPPRETLHLDLIRQRQSISYDIVVP